MTAENGSLRFFHCRRDSRLRRVEHRLDLFDRLVITRQDEPDSSINRPHLRNTIVILKVFEHSVVSWGEVLHHDESLESSGPLGVGGGRGVVFLTAKESQPVKRIDELDDNRRSRGGLRRSRARSSSPVALRHESRQLGDRCNNAFGFSSRKDGLKYAIVGHRRGGFGPVLLVLSKRKAEEAKSEAPRGLVSVVVAFFKHPHLLAKRRNGGLLGGCLGLEDCDLLLELDDDTLLLGDVGQVKQYEVNLLLHSCRRGNLELLV
jgi:hypothetical protein